MKSKRTIGALLCLFTPPASPLFVPRCGKSESNPCEIYTYQDLRSINDNGLDLYYTLMNDITADPTVSFEPIAARAFGSFRRFSGVFNGNGHTIRNLYINGSAYAGMFSILEGQVHNLILTNITVIGKDQVGALAGRVSGRSSTSVSGITIVNPTIRGSSNVGGIAGDDGSATAAACCHVIGGSIHAEEDYVGGLFGFKLDGSIQNCTSTKVNVRASESHSGGLVGQLEDEAKIYNSYATGVVVEGSALVGGLVGFAGYGTKILNSYAIGDVNVTETQGNSYGGGLLGQQDSECSITNSFAIGVFYGGGTIGGLVGNSPEGSLLQNNYAALGPAFGNRQAKDNEAKVVSDLSRFQIQQSEPLSSWDANTWIFERERYPTLQCVPGVGNGIFVGGPYRGKSGEPIHLNGTTSDFQGASYTWTVDNNKCAFTDNKVIGPVVSCSSFTELSTLVRACLTISFDQRSVEKCTSLFITAKPSGPSTGFAPGCGTKKSDPCEVSTYQDLKNIELHGIDLHYVLAYDVNGKKGERFAPIGSIKSKPFTGTFDGRGHTIRKLHIGRRDDSDVGLFWKVVANPPSTSIVSNLVLEDSVLVGRAYVGALAGSTYGGGVSIANVTVTNVKAKGLFDVGGLVGHTREGNNISCCHVIDGTVTGESTTWAGGLVGSSNGAFFEQCSAQRVKVTSSRRGAGGLLGVASSAGGTTISNCFARDGIVTGLSFVGGLVGYLSRSNSIQDSYASSDVQVTGDPRNLDSRGGGLVGSTFEGASICNSYASGSVSGGNIKRVGGLVGLLERKVKLENNHCAHDPAIGNTQVKETQAAVVKGGASYFQNKSNEPMGSWNRNSWIFQNGKDPTLQCLSNADTSDPFKDFHEIACTLNFCLNRLRNQFDSQSADFGESQMYFDRARNGVAGGKRLIKKLGEVLQSLDKLKAAMVSVEKMNSTFPEVAGDLGTSGSTCAVNLLEKFINTFDGTDVIDEKAINVIMGIWSRAKAKREINKFKASVATSQRGVSRMMKALDRAVVPLCDK